VQATNIETNVTFFGETNMEGLYTIPNLSPGAYRIIVQKFAFRTIVKPDVDLQVQDVISLNFSMELGSSAESVMAEAGGPLVQAGPQRGGNFLSGEVRVLPLVSLNPISLARTLPGVIEPTGSFLYGQGGQATQFSVNGQRPRANNYLLDSTENNDIAFTGIAQPFNIADAVEEVSVQTGNFGVEFGRAGGGVFNVVTKSGTNSLHGTTMWRYQSQRFDSVSNLDKLNGTPKSVFSRNVYGFTLGGAVRENRTFFFASFQEDALRSTQNFPLTVPTESAVATLRSWFPSNPRLDLYLGLLGGLRGSANPIPLQLGVDPLTGVDRGQVQFAAAPLALSVSDGGPQWLLRLDHNSSEAHRLAFRYIFDYSSLSPTNVYFPGFVLDQIARNQNLLATDQYSFSASWANEFRFTYGRQDADTRRISTQSVPLAQTLPRINIASIASPGVEFLMLQDRQVSNFLFQETQTKLIGHHTFRYGLEFLRQLATQLPASRSQGEFTYTDAAGYSAFANYLDDFSGPSGTARKDFGAIAFHPDQFRQVYFFQDNWLPVPSLYLTLGLRYENFGQPANIFKYPAFVGYKDADILSTAKVKPDNNNFAPSIGLAWNPTWSNPFGHFLTGDGKAVLRAGYQVSYDTWFNNLLSNMAAGSPNALANTPAASTVAAATPRGRANLAAVLPTLVPVPVNPYSTQQSDFDQNIRNPYYHRFSLGIQREIPKNMVVDLSYVGTMGRQLYYTNPLNPTLPNATGTASATQAASANCPAPCLLRFASNRGLVQVRDSGLTSSYNAMQATVRSKGMSTFIGRMAFVSAYTWSKNLDVLSETFATNSSGQNPSHSPVFGSLKATDWGPSDNDRRHVWTTALAWDVRGPKRGILYQVLGGWQFAPIITIQSGTPFTVLNGTDRDWDGSSLGDRATISNPNANIYSFARQTAVTAACPTGYTRPGVGCVDPSTVYWVSKITNASDPNISGRNSHYTTGYFNVDANVLKTFRVTERFKVEYRAEIFNLNNNQNWDTPVASGNRSIATSSASTFLNPFVTKNGGNRSMRMGLKVIF